VARVRPVVWADPCAERSRKTPPIAGFARNPVFVRTCYARNAVVADEDSTPPCQGGENKPPVPKPTKSTTSTKSTASTMSTKSTAFTGHPRVKAERT